MHVFFGFLRVGEMVVPSDAAFDPTVHLAHSYVRLDNMLPPTYIEVCLKSSKTEPFRQGFTLVKNYVNVTVN